MRHIYRYTEQAKKYLSAIIKTKMPKAEPWLHVAVKTWSNRNPWSGIVVFVWDTRKVIFEHRFNKSFNITNEMMRVANSGMQRAIDNREPLVGGRKDINELMEFGPDFDASHGKAFDGKDRIQFTNMYKRRSAKSMPKPGTEAKVTEFSSVKSIIDDCDRKYHSLRVAFEKYHAAMSALANVDKAKFDKAEPLLKQKANMHQRSYDALSSAFEQ